MTDFHTDTGIAKDFDVLHPEWGVRRVPDAAGNIVRYAQSGEVADAPLALDAKGECVKAALAAFGVSLDAHIVQAAADAVPPVYVDEEGNVIPAPAA